MLMYLECSRNQQSVYKGSLPSCSDSSSSNSSWLNLAFLLSSAWPLTRTIRQVTAEHAANFRDLKQAVRHTGTVWTVTGFN
jgi:hypothetical protein